VSASEPRIPRTSRLFHSQLDGNLLDEGHGIYPFVLFVARETIRNNNNNNNNNNTDIASFFFGCVLLRVCLLDVLNQASNSAAILASA